MHVSAIVLLVFCFGQALSEKEWWDGASLYQVYPRSFKDSDGDGNGDIQGITSKVDYLASLGVTAVWISPIFKSPLEDGGYDITDFKDINHKFGNMQDFDKMVDAFHKKGIKVLLDFVPNHTSDKHNWFKDSIEGKNGKKDYYVWRNSSDKNQPPNNWVNTTTTISYKLWDGLLQMKSMFGGSAWTYNDKRKQFYLHQFGNFQPDLNYNNPAVVKDMKDVLRFWMQKHNVDGFRLDAAPYLVETNYDINDEQIKNCSVYDCFTHKYSRDQNETYTLLKEFEEVVSNCSTNSSKVIFVEAYASLENTMRYYSKRVVPFNFNLLSLSKNSKAKDFVEKINEWMTNMPKDNQKPNWVIGNHDNERIATKMGKNMASVMNVIVKLLPGTSVTYYGEEISMTNYKFDKSHDARDGARTPMQWDTSTSAGFSINSKTWLPVNPNYKEINVEVESKSNYSDLIVYNRLSELKERFADKQWKFVKELTNSTFGFRRQNILVVVNTDNKEDKVLLHELELSGAAKQLMHTDNLNITNDDIDLSKPLKMKPNSAVVIEMVGGASTVFASVTLLIACISAVFTRYNN